MSGKWIAPLLLVLYALALAAFNAPLAVVLGLLGVFGLLAVSGPNPGAEDAPEPWMTRPDAYAAVLAAEAGVLALAGAMLSGVLLWSALGVTALATVAMLAFAAEPKAILTKGLRAPRRVRGTRVPVHTGLMGVFALAALGLLLAGHPGWWIPGTPPMTWLVFWILMLAILGGD